MQGGGNKMSTYVIGDMHGAHKALEQCLDRCDFDPAEDVLITLGDICDGWPFVKECVEMLEVVPNLVGVLGNHDQWAIEWAKTGEMQDIWVTQGGENTLKSFGYDPNSFPLDFFKQFVGIMESEGQVFVHGGLDPNQRDLSKQSLDVCLWDRSLVHAARLKHAQKPDFKYGGWKDIFVGHTTTEYFEHDDYRPLHFCNIWMIDTGGGWSGKLTIMDIDTKQYWQSDIVADLYPGIKGRR